MSRLAGWLAALVVLAGVLVVGAHAALGGAPASPATTVYGQAIPLGSGEVRSYAELAGSRPVSLGMVVTERAMASLPTARSNGQYCFDRNGDGKVEPDVECVAEHEYVLELPEQFTRQVGGPFRWAMLTWDPHGHAPDGIYGVPHFDMHFYLQDRTATQSIGTGPCAGMSDCADYAAARIPVPDRYRPSGYVDIDAVVPGMGNHLGDPASPEFHGHHFSHTFMYGTYGGQITFYEPMVDKHWLEGLAPGGPATCTPIKAPTAWRVGGWYPTTYCIEHRPQQRDFAVSMRDFVFRPAS
jgi:hypothetical protein